MKSSNHSIMPRPAGSPSPKGGGGISVGSNGQLSISAARPQLKAGSFANGMLKPAGSKSPK